MVAGEDTNPGVVTVEPRKAGFLMVMFRWLLCLSGLLLAASFGPPAQAQAKSLKPTKEWKGNMPDEALQRGAPEVITNAKALEKLWSGWKIEGKVPEVDFTKEIVLITTTRGSRLGNLSARLDEKGDLASAAISTRDLAPGFRYAIGTFSREGVKTVNRKELPKE